MFTQEADRRIRMIMEGLGREGQSHVMADLNPDQDLTKMATKLGVLFVEKMATGSESVHITGITMETRNLQLTLQTQHLILDNHWF